MMLPKITREKGKVHWQTVRVEPAGVERIEPAGVDPYYGPLSALLMKDGTTIRGVTGSTYQVEQLLFGFA